MLISLEGAQAKVRRKASAKSVPHWCDDPSGGRKPLNAKPESVSRLPIFREAYALRRCIVPVDGFFEWRAIKSAQAKQPYAIAMKDGSPFGLAGLWENWRNPKTGEWVGTHPCHHHGAVKRAGG
jgi:putative SOS response-associated peptidase YedK